MEKELSRDFKGIWIARELWLHPELTMIQKALIAEIDSLDDGSGCYASNEYLARMFNTSEAGMANLISKLRKLGFIENVSFNGRERRIRVNPTVKSALTQLGEGRVNPPMKSYIDRENKREKNRVQAPSYSIPLVLKNSEFQTVWDSFVADRKERRKPVTSRSAEILLTRLAERPAQAAEVCRMMIEKGWSSFQWEWIDKAKSGFSSRKEKRPVTKTLKERGYVFKKKWNA